MKSNRVDSENITSVNLAEEEISGLNWGAFFFSLIWGVAMKVPQAWLTLIPGIGLIVPFVLLVKGNEWAWQRGNWDSIEDFRRVQSNWAWASLVFCIILFIFSLIIALELGAGISH